MSCRHQLRCQLHREAACIGASGIFLRKRPASTDVNCNFFQDPLLLPNINCYKWYCFKIRNSTANTSVFIIFSESMFLAQDPLVVPFYTLDTSAIPHVAQISEAYALRCVDDTAGRGSGHHYLIAHRPTGCQPGNGLRESRKGIEVALKSMMFFEKKNDIC